MLQLIHLEHVIIDFSVTIQHHANFFPAQKLILTVFWDFGHLIFVRPKMSTSVTVFMQISTKKITKPKEKSERGLPTKANKYGKCLDHPLIRSCGIRDMRLHETITQSLPHCCV